MYKIWLFKALNSSIKLQSGPALSRWLAQMTSKCPSQPKLFCDSIFLLLLNSPAMLDGEVCWTEAWTNFFCLPSQRGLLFFLSPQIILYIRKEKGWVFLLMCRVVEQRQRSLLVACKYISVNKWVTVLLTTTHLKLFHQKYILSVPKILATNVFLSHWSTLKRANYF